MERVTLTEFVGAPSATAWSRVEELRLSVADKIFVAFSVTGDDAGSIGREVVAHLRAEKPISFQAMYEFLLHLNVLVQDRGGALSLAAGFIGGGESGWLTLNGSISLLREDKFGTVVSGPGLNIRVGQVRDDDVYVLATAGGSGLAQEVRSLKERGYKLDGSISTISRLLQTHPQSDQTAVCVLRVVSEATAMANEVEAEEVFSASAVPTVAVAPVLPAEESFKPRRLDLNESSDTISSVARDGAVARVEHIKKIGGKAGPILIGTGKTLLKVFQALGKMTLSLVNVLMQKFGKKRVLTTALPGDVSGPVRKPLSTKKVVAMITTGVGLLLLLLLLVIGFTIWRRNVRDQALAFVQPYNDRYETALQLHRLDPIRGRDQLERLIQELRTAQAESEQGTEQRTAIDATLAKAENKLHELIGTDAVSTVPVWLDLQAQAPGFVASKVSSQPGWIFVADTSLQTGFLINTQLNTTTPVSLSGVPSIIATDLPTNEQLITLGGGIHSVATTDGATATLTEESDANRAGNLVASFNSNVYVFNPETRRIYRYTQTDGTLSAPANWLSSTLGFQAEDVYDMAVDGSLWLTTKTGELHQFTSGRSTSFEISQLPDPLAGPISLVAHPDQEYLYLFAPNQERVVVLTKEVLFGHAIFLY